MLLRRLTPLSLVLASAACAPSVPKEQNATAVTYAVFDVTPGKLPEIPQPNNLVLTADLSTLPLPDAQKDLLGEFQAAGGFPNDQDVPITIDFQKATFSADGLRTNSAPDLDLATVIPGQTIAVRIRSGGIAGGITAADLEPPTYSKGADRGTLTLHNKGFKRWPAGSVVEVGVRGGPNGVKTTDGALVQPTSTTFLLIQDKDLSDPANQSLIVLQTGSRSAAEDLGRQLEALRKSYLQAFADIDAVFPHGELALVQTFNVAPALAPHVETDTNTGNLPLPIDLLRDPRPGGLVTPLAACAIVSGKLDAQGVCKDANNKEIAAAKGFQTLDGFSTTAMLLAPLSGLVNADTIDKTSVLLYELASTGPKFIDPNGPDVVYEIQPSPIKQTPDGAACPSPPVTGTLCLTNVIGLQPAAPATINGLRSTPLKDATNYGVIVTNKVKDINGAGLSRSTIGKILLFQHPLVTGTSSNLIGIDAATAGALEVMRQQVDALVTKAIADGKITGRPQVAMAYTFRTQTIKATTDFTNPAIPFALAAAPYQKLPDTPLAAPVNETADHALDRYGIDKSIVSTSEIATVWEVPMLTLNLLSPANGAFRTPADQTATCVQTDPLNPLSNPCLEIVKALVVVPKTVTATCPAPLGEPANVKCAPLVVYRHGLLHSRGNALTLANRMAQDGMVVVAIDAAKLGERSFCTTLPGTPQPQCSNGTTCTALTEFAGQGDAIAPGTCGGGLTNYGKNYRYRPMLCDDPVNKCPQWVANQASAATAGGIPLPSGNYIVSSNFFRTRDTFRQDILDQSQLIHVMTGKTVTTPHAVYETLKAMNIRINPLQVFFIGQALGGENGIVDLAANPFVSKVALSSAGGTIVDALTNATDPTFSAQVTGLLTSLGINRATDPAGYLKFLSVAKWVLDPAEPMNYAENLNKKMLKGFAAPTNPVAPPFSTDIAPRAVLGQRSQCDPFTPDAFQGVLYNASGAVPVLPLPAPGLNNPPCPPDKLCIAGTVFTKDPTGQAVAPSLCPTSPAVPLPAFAVSDGILTDFSTPSLTTQAQDDIAKFFSAVPVTPPPVRVP